MSNVIEINCGDCGRRTGHMVDCPRVEDLEREFAELCELTRRPLTAEQWAAMTHGHPSTQDPA